MRTSLIVMVVLALSSTEAVAQSDSRELQELLSAAEQANVDRRLSVEQIRRSEAEFRQAWTALLPSLSVQAGWTHNQYSAEIAVPQSDGTINNLVIVPKNQLDAAIRFELPLIDTGRWFRTAAAQAGKEAAASRDALSSTLVQRNVVVAYYGYVASVSVRESAKKSLAVAEAQLKLIEARAGVGSATELEVLRARAEMQRARQTVADTEAAVATGARSVQSLTGRAPQALPMLGTDNLAPEPTVKELEADIDNLPSVKTADLELNVSKKLLWSARLALVPTLSANFTERFTNATGFQGRSALYTAGVTLVWRLDAPTFMAMSVQSAATSSAELQAERARLNARDQINSDWQRLNAALTKVQAAQAQVEAAQRAAQVARDRYEVGASTQVELIQADRDRFGAEVQQIQARTELAMARASLHISTGRAP